MQANIIDCSLREGCQTIQCNFDIEQSEILARKIAEFGVDMIECGHPKISPYELERVRAVVRVSPLPVLAHARCRSEDIDAVAESGAAWVGMFASFNPVSLATKFGGMGKDQVLALFEASIRYAKSRGLSVRATIEDAGRTEQSDLFRIYQTAVAAGADRICFADSVGALLPSETYDILALLRHEFRQVQFEYHVHNDRGLALASSLEALRAGVEWISTSCNGIGERAGVTDTFQLAALLESRFGDASRRLDKARQLSELVRVFSRIDGSPMQPIVGDNVFAHASRLHRIACEKDASAYNIHSPALAGDAEVREKHPPMHEQDLFLVPFEKSSTELRYHRHGPGKRFVMLDHRLLSASPFYFIARKVEVIAENEEGHVDTHRHNCDSVFMFLGDYEDYRGLTVEVSIAGVSRTLTSPATAFVPAGAEHSYRFVAGKGSFINFVHKGEYARSLLEIAA
ncbi:2-isopropylmalate synthase [Burkholderia glumae]|uniref:LeuA family protein n=1 Tax=Burkholderia glumae TaxID=337 RepID=UPI0012952013|nr:LeuA family protein [Burkholderia glumae]QGA39518.1 2-isopropylmalate synthase [Burkholderia glumae]